MQAAADAEKTSLTAIRDTWFEVRKASLRYGVEPQDFEAAAGGASTGP
jgi:hypothetical protein